MKHSRSVTALIGVAIWCPAAAIAQQDTIAPQDRPFVEGGAFDKPYLTRLLGRAAIGGYVEAHARLERTDGVIEERGFEAKRFNIFIATQVSDFVRIGAELEFEEGAEEIKLEFATIDISVHRALRFRGGMLLSPLGRFNLAHDSPLNEFTDRPLVSTEVIGTALSEPGFGAFGLFPVGRTGRITYELYAVNGFADGLIQESAEGTRIPLGRGNFEDNNQSLSAVGRVTWSPNLDFEFGFSAHHGAYNVFEQDGEAVDEKRDVTIAVLDLNAEAFGFRASGEFALANIDVAPALLGLFAEDQRGLYFEVLRDFGSGWIATMPNSFFTVGARLDVVDFDADVSGDNVRQVTVGFNFRPTLDSVVKLDYVRGRSRDRFNNVADHVGFQLSLATYF